MNNLEWIAVWVACVVVVFGGSVLMDKWSAQRRYKKLRLGEWQATQGCKCLGSPDYHARGCRFYEKDEADLLRERARKEVKDGWTPWGVKQ